MDAIACTNVEQDGISKIVVALMTLTLCWVIKTGEWLHQHQPINIKKHGCKAKSIFRYGFDFCLLTLHCH